MALIRSLERAKKERFSVHKPVECSYTIFESAGEKYLQLDTHGSESRRLKGKVSQSLQLDRESGAALMRILKKAFPDANHS